jgi:hypothetical protein
VGRKVSGCRDLKRSRSVRAPRQLTRSSPPAHPIDLLAYTETTCERKRRPCTRRQIKKTLKQSKAVSTSLRSDPILLLSRRGPAARLRWCANRWFVVRARLTPASSAR